MANGTQPIVKISGYLEKKAKLRIGSPWKKYWFVLEGRLLLYYRSKDEYEALSPCKGSINLCPPCNVKPALSAAGVFQIECRASTVTLRAENRQEQERWMQALLAAIAQSKSSPNRMSHFRYSLDDLPVPTKVDKKSECALSRQNTMPHRISSSAPKKGTKDIIERLQQMGAQTYGGSLGTITKLANRDHEESVNCSPNLDERSSSSQDVTSNSRDDNSDCSASTSIENAKLSNDKRNARSSQSVEKMQNLLYDTDQYSIIQEENSIEVFLDQESGRIVNSEKTKSVIVDNDQYVGQDMVKTVENEKCKEDKFEKLQRKTSFIVENEQYCSSNKNGNESAEYIRNKETQKIEHLYERISSDSTISECNVEHTKNTTIESSHRIRQNVINLYERISTGSSNSDSQPKLNDQYSVVLKDNKQTEIESLQVKNLTDVKRISDHEYSVPINFKNDATDHNKNSLIIDNDHYLPTADDKSNDNPYANGLLFTAEYVEYDAIDKAKELEELYEDPDRLKKHQQERESSVYQDVEPMLPPRPDSKKHESSEETSSQSSSNDGNNKRKNSRFRKLAQLVRSDKKCDVNNDTGKTKSKKRSTSFLRRVWRRKAKSLDAEEEIAYEAVEYELIEKQTKKDQNDVQMLQELQKILETRKTMLQEKLNANENKVEQNKPDVAESQVHPILEEKEDELPAIRSDEAVDDLRPDLPPRQSSHHSLSPYHDVPQNNKAVELNDSTVTDFTNNSNNNITNIDDEYKSNGEVKTIDEILEDLDKEKDIRESRQKVKQLIEKFNDFQGEEEVVLRKKSKCDVCKPQSDECAPRINWNEYTSKESDELTKLLEELSKVTCAPVLTPGVTSSLVTPVLTDDEWLQLIPIRRRRLSEPDYDVPRPHRSLQLQGRNKQITENPIPATRFFGPILPIMSKNNNAVAAIESPSWSSMDPDSLEVLPATTPVNQRHSAASIISPSQCVDKDHGVCSYTSHDYVKKDEVIYAHPKTVTLNTKSVQSDQNIYSNFNLINQQNNVNKKEHVDNIEVNVRTIEINKSLAPVLLKSDETFIDSLEPLAEISTAF